jgi:hypothetical protein
MIKTNTKSKVSFIRGIQSKYNNGQLITDREWKRISDLVNTVDIIEQKQGYLKTCQLIDRFVGADIDEFVTLTQQHNIMLKVIINIYDYLKFKQNKESSVILSDSHALSVINGVFEDLEKLLSTREVYLTEDFE